MTNTYKLYTALLIVCATVLCASGALFAYADNSHAPAKYIIIFENGAYQDKAEQDKLIASVGGKVTLPLAFMNAVAVEVPEKAVAQILAHKPGVASVHENLEMTLLKRPAPVPTPTVEVVDWGVKRIQADQVWSTGAGRGEGVNIAVLDTGIDEDHPDLKANVAGCVGFITLEYCGTDNNGHGTHVAGTIAAVDNEIGVVGVANEANLYGVQVLNRRGSGDIAGLVSGLNWAVQTHHDGETNTENDIDIITMSIGFPLTTLPGQLTLVEEQIKLAEEAGIVVVAAAGNNYADDVTYPAAYETVIAVAATNYNTEDASDLNDYLINFSNYGTGVDVAAPGVNILSTWKGGTYNTISGTSMATPHVTGVVALMLGKTNSMSNDNVRTRIAGSVDPIISGIYSFGRINAETALLGL